MPECRTREFDVVFCVYCQRPLLTIFVDHHLSGICLDCHRVSDEVELKDVYQRMVKSAPIYH